MLAVEAEGENAFRGYSLPQVVIRFRADREAFPDAAEEFLA